MTTMMMLMMRVMWALMRGVPRMTMTVARMMV